MPKANGQIYCISYPCSGRNWLMNIVENYCPERISFTHDILEKDSAQNTTTWEDIHKYKESGKMDAWKKMYAHRKNVILTRDPRDVVISYFYQKKYREPYLLSTGFISEAGNFDGSIEDFVKDDIFGIKTIVEFMNLWVDLIKSGSSLHVTYEAMHENPVSESSRLIEFAGVDVDNSKIKMAVLSSEFGKHQFAESLSFGDNLNVYKYRRGIMGGYKEELSQKTIAEINKIIQKNLDKFYYMYGD